MTRGTKRLGERETAELREAFELFDSEKSGKINLCVLAHHATTKTKNEPRAAPQARAQGPAARAGLPGAAAARATRRAAAARRAARRRRSRRRT